MVLARAVTSTVDASTAKISLDVSISGLGRAGDVSVSGVVNFRTQDAQMAFQSSAATLEERVVGGIIYMRGLRLAPNRWISIDPKKLLGANLDSFSQSQTDPSQYLAFISAVSDDARREGNDATLGEPTVRYHATLDIAKALHREGIPAALRDRLVVLAPAFANLKLPMEIWVDAQGRVRKMQMQMFLADMLRGTAAASQVPGDATMTMTIEYSDFGVPVTVEAPPAKDVVPLDSLSSRRA